MRPHMDFKVSGVEEFLQAVRDWAQHNFIVAFLAPCLAYEEDRLRGTDAQASNRFVLFN